MYAPAEKEVDQIFQTFYNAPSFNSWQISLIKGTLLLRWSWQRIRLTISDRIFHLTAVCTYNDGGSCYDEYLKNTSHTEEKFVSISRKPKFKPPVIEIYGRFGMRSFSSFLWEHTGYFDFVLSCFQDACREEIHLMKIYYFFIMVKLLNDTIYIRYIL